MTMWPGTRSPSSGSSASTRSARLLPHDYIVNVTDFQRDPVAGVWLLVMEYLDGEELRIVLKRTHVLPPARVIRMLSQMAIGLDEAHARHFVHRDLKPDNIFLCGTRDGDVVKLLDFGSVKDKNKDAKKLTVLGTTIGSPYYMAPEQAQGLDTLDARADVFALAAITYECVDGIRAVRRDQRAVDPAVHPDQGSRLPRRSVGRAPLPDPAGSRRGPRGGAHEEPAIRTRTVGALADAVGRAYGLTGDHREWARLPSQHPREDVRRVAAAGRTAAPDADRRSG